ncbi:hypothetical protein HTZ84_11855 [Haloterrigena sp. SYSU A558-1]|uniref:Uncharacterized protein n=1 Tax=Haloterrigena gelatinilytica TaxID=2741724 RepID=A0ABX2LGL9_9EURY|nr:hypothetical protein [Haloterrigena gelatinilytica]NUC72996.1 hypothetical protein [Haloterrigena gelatinilytica]
MTQLGPWAPSDIPDPSQPFTLFGTFLFLVLLTALILWYFKFFLPPWNSIRLRATIGNLLSTGRISFRKRGTRAYLSIFGKNGLLTGPVFTLLILGISIWLLPETNLGKDVPGQLLSLQVGLTGAGTIVIVFLIERIASRDLGTNILNLFLARSKVVPFVGFLLSAIGANATIVHIVDASRPVETTGVILLSAGSLVAIGGFYWLTISLLLGYPFRELLESRLQLQVRQRIHRERLRAAADELVMSLPGIGVGQFTGSRRFLDSTKRVTGANMKDGESDGYLSDINYKNIRSITIQDGGENGGQVEAQISAQIGDRIKPNTTLVQIDNRNGTSIDSVKLSKTFKVSKDPVWRTNDEEFANSRSQLQQLAFEAIQEGNEPRFKSICEIYEELVKTYYEDVSSEGDWNWSLSTDPIGPLYNDLQEIHDQTIELGKHDFRIVVIDTIAATGYRWKEARLYSPVSNALTRLRSCYVRSPSEIPHLEYPLLSFRQILLGMDVTSADSLTEFKHLYQYNQKSLEELEWILKNSLEKDTSLGFKRSWNLTKEYYSSERESAIRSEVNRIRSGEDSEQEKSSPSSRISVLEAIQERFLQAIIDRQRLLFTAASALFHYYTEGSLSEDTFNDIRDNAVLEYFDSVEVVVEGYNAIFSGSNDPLKLERWGDMFGPDDFGGAKAVQMTVGDWILDGYCLLLLANFEEDWLNDSENLPSENPIPAEDPIIQREEEIINRLEEIPDQYDLDELFEGMDNVNERIFLACAFHEMAAEQAKDEERQRIADSNLDQQNVDTYKSQFRNGFGNRISLRKACIEAGIIEGASSIGKPSKIRRIQWKNILSKRPFVDGFGQVQQDNTARDGAHFAEQVRTPLVSALQPTFDEVDLESVEEVLTEIEYQIRNNDDIIAIVLGDFDIEGELWKRDTFEGVRDGAIGHLLDIPVYSDSYKEFDAAIIFSAETATLQEQYEDNDEIPIIHVQEVDPATVANQASLNPEQSVLIEVDYKYKPEAEVQNGIFYHLQPSENAE